MKGLEAVFIATPPHWHALVFLAACEKGLDIYCEKPLAYDVREGQAMITAAGKAGNIVQIGFQRRQSKAFGKARELLDAGRIGNLLQVNAQINYVPELKDTTTQMSFKRAPVVWQHRLWGTGDVNGEFNNGIFLYGDKGTLFADDSRIMIFDAGKDVKREDLSFPSETMQEDHVKNFLDSVRAKNKKLISCTPHDAFKSTTTVQFAMISYYTGSAVKWDFKNKEITGNPEASALLERAYRSGYKHP